MTLNRLLVVIVLAAVIGGSGWWVWQKEKDASTAPGDSTLRNDRPHIGAPATPEFGINAKEFANNPQALADEYVAELNEFRIAGVNEDVAMADERFTMSDAEYVDSLSASIDQAFLDAMFVDDYESNPKLASYIDTEIEIAHNTRQGRMTTMVGAPDDKEPYVREVVVDSTTGTIDPLVTNTRWHEYDNRDMNTIETLFPDFDPNNETGGTALTWVVEDGMLKVSDVDYYAG